jgi:3-demethoxyubiquinol 3-hydroxylase
MDALIAAFDRALRTVSGVCRSARESPAIAKDVLESPSDRRHSAALMRVNHSGEVCAQALYEAQAMFSKTERVRSGLRKSAVEEEDHLGWTRDRLVELGGRRSILDPLWYAGAFGIGALAAKSGDATNLGFLVETERQVVAHLNQHLEKIPLSDERSRQVLRQMIADEAAHADLASAMGGVPLSPATVAMMRLSAKAMTSLAYHL